MQLWTDYEGVTIDGVYSLRKLLMPEGRSAFYSTSGPNGEPTVVRLIECHFDEEEILGRWRSVEALNHPNFLKFQHFGQTEIDGRPVVYAVFEKVDGNLAEVLDRGHLVVEDVAQLASSVVAALEVMHNHGFVHEHIEPRNIFAVGDVVKLRSDCIREAPEGEEGRLAKQRDIHDLATVLLQSLTQRTSLEGVADASLPTPFGQIIRSGLNGTWSLESIKTAVDRYLASKQPKVPAVVPVIPAVAAPVASAPGNENAAPVQKAPAPAAAAKTVVPEAQLPLPLANEPRTPSFTRADSAKDAWVEDTGFSLRSRWVGVAVMAAVLLIFAVWVISRASHSSSPQPQQAGVTQPAEQAVPRAAATPAPIAASAPSANITPGPDSHAGWHVIAFTYNRRADAEKKVADLQRHHTSLHPAVFSPNGRAPYYVSVGGVMQEQAAYALARRARYQGFPRDTFARNYR